MAEHGTNARYQIHRRHQRRRAQEAAMNAARGRAWRRLAARHPEEFRELYEREKRRFGHEGS